MSDANKVSISVKTGKITGRKSGGNPMRRFDIEVSCDDSATDDIVKKIQPREKVGSAKKSSNGTISVTWDTLATKTLDVRREIEKAFETKRLVVESNNMKTKLNINDFESTRKLVLKKLQEKFTAKLREITKPIQKSMLKEAPTFGKETESYLDVWVKTNSEKETKVALDKVIALVGKKRLTDGNSVDTKDKTRQNAEFQFDSKDQAKSFKQKIAKLPGVQSVVIEESATIARFAGTRKTSGPKPTSGWVYFTNHRDGYNIEKVIKLDSSGSGSSGNESDISFEIKNDKDAEKFKKAAEKLYNDRKIHAATLNDDDHNTVWKIGKEKGLSDSAW